MFIIFYTREISYKTQFIKSLPLISNTRQPALDNCNPKVKVKNVNRMK